MDLRIEGVFPAPREQLWKLFAEHQDTRTLRRIHPWILTEQVIEETDPVEFGGMVFAANRAVERDVKFGGRRSTTTWTYRIRPPDRYDYEIRFEKGSRAAFENSYSEASEGTRISTKGVVSIRGLPGFLQGWFANRILNRADREDLEYLRKMQL